MNRAGLEKMVLIRQFTGWTLSQLASLNKAVFWPPLGLKHNVTNSRLILEFLGLNLDEQEEIRRIGEEADDWEQRKGRRSIRNQWEGMKSMIVSVILINMGPTYITNSNNFCQIANNRLNYLMTSLIGMTPFC